MLYYYDWNKSSLQVSDAGHVSFISDIYREQPYLDCISEEALVARLNALVINLITIDLSGDPEFQVIPGQNAIAFVELLEELKARNLSIDRLLKQCMDRFLGLRSFSNAREIGQKLEDLEGYECLYKFTKHAYASAILRGEVRFKTASSYGREGLNMAIRDDELNINHDLSGLSVTSADGTEIPRIDNRITSSAEGDYYISCFSISCDLKLFMLFEADTCVVIKSVDRFVESVVERYKSLYPNSRILFGQVEYIDPMKQLRGKGPIEFRKICDFSYEKEGRFVSYDYGGHPILGVERTIHIDASDLEYDIISV